VDGRPGRSLKQFLLWIGVSVALSPIIYIGTTLVLSTWYKTYRDPGWGREKEAFPLVVLTRGADGKPVAHVVTQGELKDFTGYSFVLPPHEREEIDRQLDAMREGESDKPDSGKFQLLSLDVRDLPDGSQRVHLNASQYDDTINESWYVAHAKSIEPLYHRQNVDIGVGIAAAFGAMIPTMVISPIVGGAVVLLLRRRRRRSATRS
jgi:hypothetical protein